MLPRFSLLLFMWTNRKPSRSPANRSQTGIRSLLRRRRPEALISPRPLLFALTLGALVGCHHSEPPTATEKSHRAILYFDGERRLQMDYEGTGYRQSSLVNGESVEFKAMHLNHWTDQDIHNRKWVDASFKGTVATSGEDGHDVRVYLKVENKVPFEIQTMGITPKGSQESSEPIAHQFSPGDHELLIEGKVTGLYEKP